MTELIVEKGDFSRKIFQDKKDLFLYIIEYLEDLEDKNNVLNSIKNNKNSSSGISLDDFIGKYGE